MKRLVFLALALILIINIVGCSVVDTGDGNETGDNAVSTGETSAETQNGGDNAPDNITALEKKQVYISENGGLFGVSYLGFYEDRQEKVSDFVKKQKYYDAMAFLAEVSDDSTVSASGAELYVVVPASGISLTVYELSLDETTFEYKKSKAVFTSEKGEPFYLIGNVSDIIPTFIIAAEKEGKTVEYSPCLSLKDGKLSTPCEGVIDLTPYKYMGDFIYSMADESADYNVTVTKERAESILKQNSLTPKNVIVLIGDGMGENDIEITEKYGQGVNSYGLLLNMFPHSGYAKTYSLDNEVTDSAASGTALSAGFKTNNGYIGMTPDGRALKTMAEFARDAGKRVGIVTDDHIFGATPSAFVTHNESRYNYGALANGILQFSPEVIIGKNFEDLKGIIDDNAKSILEEKYLSAEGTGSFEEVKDKCLKEGKLFAGANGGCCDAVSDHLAVSAMTAIELLKNENGFFLMIEGCGTDAYGHSNSIKGKMASVVNLDKTLEKILLFMEKNPDTLLIVTSDHETGGVVLPKEGEGPTDELFSVTTHTSADVRVFCFGDGSFYFDGKTVDNTEIAKFVRNAIEGR